MKREIILITIMAFIIGGIMVESAVDERNFVYNGTHWIPWLSTSDGKPKVDLNLVNISAVTLITNTLNVTGNAYLNWNGTASLMKNSSNISCSYDDSQWSCFYNASGGGATFDPSTIDYVNQSMLDNATIIRTSNISNLIKNGSNISAFYDDNQWNLGYNGSAGGGAGDDLGDHTATENLDMNSFNITNTQKINSSVSSSYFEFKPNGDVIIWI